MKKSFIFDLDGTLLDSMDRNNIDYEYLNSEGITTIPDNLHEIFKPFSLYEAAEYFINEFKINRTNEEVCNRINNMIEDKYKFHNTNPLERL